MEPTSGDQVKVVQGQYNGKTGKLLIVWEIGVSVRIDDEVRWLWREDIRKA